MLASTFLLWLYKVEAICFYLICFTLIKGLQFFSKHAFFQLKIFFEKKNKSMMNTSFSLEVSKNGQSWAFVHTVRKLRKMRNCAICAEL